MTTTAQTKGFADTIWARLLALLLAIAIAWLLWANWSSDFKALFADGEQKAAPVVSASEPAKPANPALEECLAKRVGDVERMKEEGILSDAQYSNFRSRAEELCRAQNPGG